MAGVGGIHEETLGSGLGMHAHNWVSGAAIFGNCCGILRWTCVAIAKAELSCSAEIMNRGEALEIGLHVWRQRVIGRSGRCKHRVSADFRKRFRLRERSHGRMGEERLIGVPHRCCISLVGVEDAHLFKARSEIWEECVHFDLTNASAEGHVLFGRELRGVDDQHLVLEKRSVHRIERCVVEFGREIDASDLRTKRRGESANFHQMMLTLFRATRRFAGSLAVGDARSWGISFMANLFNYSGKRVVLTGGATGIGAALVDLLDELDVAHLTILDIKAPSGRCDTFIETNLADPASIDAAIAQIEGPIDVVFSNAGVAANAGVRTCMAVNVAASRRLTDGLFDKIAKGGTIVYTASMAGNGWPAQVAEITTLLEIEDWNEFLDWCEAHPEVVNDVYAFSKMCMQVYTMRRSYSAIRNGVRINSICPAPVDTPLMADFKVSMGEDAINWAVGVQGNGRMAVATDIAPSLAFMGSDAAAFINGENLHVDSGLSSAMVTGLAFS